MTKVFLIRVVFYAKFCEEFENGHENCLQQALYLVHGQKPRWRQDFFDILMKTDFINLIIIKCYMNIYHMQRNSLVDVSMTTLGIKEIQDLFIILRIMKLSRI